MTRNNVNSILIFEWLSGGGLWVDQEEFDFKSPIVGQGWAMLNSVGYDFGSAGFDVSVLLDARCPKIPDWGRVCKVASKPQLRRRLEAVADLSEHILVIAPESGQALLKCCQWMEPWQTRCVFPDERFVRLCGNKNSVSRYLTACGVPVAVGWSLVEWMAGREQIRSAFPAVLKPIEGCGSDGVQFIATRDELQLPPEPERWRLEKFVDGVPASVSVIGGREPILLPPLRQCFDASPFGTFVNAANDLTCEQALMATQLAENVVASLPSTCGYYGIDMVITNDHAIAIEVNPRLTVSYCKLRAVCGFNLASAMVSARVVNDLATE